MNVQLLFNIAQLIVTSIIIVYVLKRWVIPAMRHEYVHEKNTYHQLADKVDVLTKECMVLNETIDEEKQTIERLQHTIDQWHSLEQNRMHQLHLMQAAYHQQAHQKETSYLTMQLQKKEHTRIMQSVIRQSEETLRNHFSSMKKGYAYNECIIQWMNENTK